MSDTITNFGKVGVLFGGRSAERDVSIMSGTGVLQALKSRGIDAHGFDPAERSLAELAAENFDCVFIALHGRYGEDGSLQGALEQLGIPYTGSGVMASSVGMDKITTKIIWLSKNIPTPRYATVAPGDDLDAIVLDLGLPLIVKPPLEGSTIGITKVEAAEQFEAAVALALGFDETVLAEEFVTGREFTVAVLGTGKHARAADRRDRGPARQLRLPEQVFYGRHQIPLPGAARRGIERRDPEACGRRLPCARLRGLGPGRRAGARERHASVPAGGEHLAGHDQPLAGADGGARGRDQLRRTVRRDPAFGALQDGEGARLRHVA
nr:D-ala D-ala ligase N-terminus [uncultured bacterium]